MSTNKGMHYSHQQSCFRFAFILTSPRITWPFAGIREAIATRTRWKDSVFLWDWTSWDKCDWILWKLWITYMRTWENPVDYILDVVGAGAAAMVDRDWHDTGWSWVCTRKRLQCWTARLRMDENIHQRVRHSMGSLLSHGLGKLGCWSSGSTSIIGTHWLIWFPSWSSMWLEGCLSTLQFTSQKQAFRALRTRFLWVF